MSSRSHVSTPIVRLGARNLRNGAYRRLFGAAGRKWNAMNCEQRYQLLLQEFPPGQASSKVSLTHWQELMLGHKVLIVILLQRSASEEKKVKRAG